MAAVTPSVRDDFLAALLAGDATRARHLVERAAENGIGVDELYLDVLAPALAEVGQLWEQGRLSVAHEHHATAVTQTVLGALGPRMRRPPQGGRLAILACVPGEQHTLGLQMAADFLEAAEWEVLQLGSGLPVPDLVALVADEQPDVVGLSVATVGMLPGALEMLVGLRELDPRPFVVVGGLAWEQVPADGIDEVGADAVVRDPRALVALVTERFPPLPDD